MDSVEGNTRVQATDLSEKSPRGKQHVCESEDKAGAQGKTQSILQLIIQLSHKDWLKWLNLRLSTWPLSGGHAAA